MPKSIALIGEAMAEFQSCPHQRPPTFGGDTLNTAVYLSRLGCHNITYFSGFGFDKLSEQALEFCRNEHLDLSGVTQIKGRTLGTYAIATDNEGERTFTYQRKNSAARHWLSEVNPNHLIKQLKKYDIIYVTGITLAIQFEDNLETLFTILESVKHSAEIWFDSNYRPRLWETKSKAQAAYSRMVSLADHVLLTFDDEQQLFGDSSVTATLARLNNYSLKRIVIKCGGNDCLIKNKDREYLIPATKVKTVVDTTSAGDAFNAGYLHAQVIGKTFEQAAVSGHLLASQVIQHHGAIMPRKAMQEFLENNK